MPKDILPPKTPTLLSTAETNRIRSANREVFENIMVDSAEDEYLTQLGTDRGVPRPAAFFADDDLWSWPHTCHRLRFSTGTPTGMFLLGKH